ncbi:MAG: FkbM family methyltransferase [Phreatobacter sp.]
MTAHPAPAFLSYAQNLEDYHLALIFADQGTGFYIDVGGGHVVADNVSFGFYERGWRGIVVEPQPALASAYRRVRPRDLVVEALCGRVSGEADFFEADRFHGLSTTSSANAEAALAAGIATTHRRLPTVTLAELCAAHAPDAIDFLKVDVEGAEAEVLAGNDWACFRPRVILLEAVTPWTMADASASFTPILAAAGYREVYFDNLNRFYMPEDGLDLAARLPKAPTAWDAVLHLGEYGPAHQDVSHPDHALARLIDPDWFARLNGMEAADLAAILPPHAEPAREATRAALARIACYFDGGFIID